MKKCACLFFLINYFIIGCNNSDNKQRESEKLDSTHVKGNIKANNLLTEISTLSNTNRIPDSIILKSFKQGYVSLPPLRRLGGGGNCASVAIIKCAISTYGLDSVFKNVKYDSANLKFTVFLKNGDSLRLTVNEIEFANSAADFELKETDEISKRIWSYAQFCFAVMCKNEQRINGYGRFKRAVTTLDKGYGANAIYKLLGVDTINITDFGNLKNLQNLVIWNAPHAVFSTNGFYDEAFTTSKTGIEPIEALNTFHCRNAPCKILGAYQLKKE